MLIELKCEIFTFRILGENDSAQNKKAKPLHDASQRYRKKIVKLFHLQQIYWPAIVRSPEKLFKF